MYEKKEIFEDHWQARTEAYESLSQEDIQSVLFYTKKKLHELSSYFNTIKLNKRSKAVLLFYTDYVEHLLKYNKNKFDMSYHMQYMYLYSELLLGSKRYITIQNHLREIDREFEEVDSLNSLSTIQFSHECSLIRRISPLTEMRKDSFRATVEDQNNMKA